MRSLRSTRQAPSLKTDLKPLADALLLGMDDGFGPVRDSAAEGLGTLHKIVGDRAMAAILDGLDDIKKKKVMDFAEKAEVRCKGMASGAPAAGKVSGRAATGLSLKPSSTGQVSHRYGLKCVMQVCAETRLFAVAIAETTAVT